METKICRWCGVEHPKNNTYFYNQKSNKDGLTRECKKCLCKYNRERKAKRKQEISLSTLQSTKICTKCNRELDINEFVISYSCNDGHENTCKECKNKYNKEYKKEYNPKNKDKISEAHKNWVANNREKMNEFKRKYNYKNREKAIQKSKEWRENNKERSIAQARNWRKNNPQKHCCNQQRRRARKSNLESTLTLEQWKLIKQHFDNKCAYCGKAEALTQDHFIPLEKGGEYTINNILPACQSCNSSKSNKIFNEWYPSYKYYDKDREHKILSFLKYKNNSQQLTLII